MITRNFPKYLFLAAAAVLLLPAGAHAQDAKKSPSPTPSLIDSGEGDSVDKTVDKFFALLTKGEVDLAFDSLLAGSKIADSPDAVAKLKASTKEAIKQFGDIRGYELISIQNAGTHLIRATYLSLGTGYPIRWKLYFYRFDKTWKLADIGVDDNLVSIFEDKPAQPQQQQQQAPQPGTGQ